jgi:putative acetyltransferase
MITIQRTTSDDHDFIGLVKLLDEDLAVRDGKEHAFYAQFNSLAGIKHALVAYRDGIPVGCGSIKEFGPNVVEIKRMFVLPEERKQGIAGKILAELETWAAELSYTHCVLETGKKQPEAIALYTRSGYRITPNYGQYAGIENSLCFEKPLI